MNYKKLLLSALIMITFNEAHAAPGFSLGHGFINGTSNRTETISLSGLLNTRDNYTISCTINHPEGDTNFSQVEFSSNTFGVINSFNLDGRLVYDDTFIILDNKNHIINASPISINLKSNSTIQFRWIGTNGDKSIPITYSCDAIASANH